MAPMSNSSTITLHSTSSDSCELVKEKQLSTTTLQRTGTESAKPMSPVKSVDLAAYYTFSKRNSKVQHDEMQGLSGFLDYRKINGTWRPFLFQTSGHQLMLYRVHSTHQVLIMSTDIRSASEIALEGDRTDENTRLLRLGVNGATITLRAVTHRAAVYWVDGLRRLRDGKALQIVGDASCTENAGQTKTKRLSITPAFCS
uniref:PH domain-containing protein n=1 Tax=Hyaloperonospora arabidopsidis (strain Emoy2) TaxID=559515 RepID=M4C249_HYAAE